jgi:hypothetical protein
MIAYMIYIYKLLISLLLIGYIFFDLNKMQWLHWMYIIFRLDYWNIFEYWIGPFSLLRLANLWGGGFSAVNQPKLISFLFLFHYLSFYNLSCIRQWSELIPEPLVLNEPSELMMTYLVGFFSKSGPNHINPDLLYLTSINPLLEIKSLRKKSNWLYTNI